MSIFGAVEARVTPREAKDAALAERQAANKQVEATEATVGAMDRATRGEDALAAMEAKHALPALRVQLERERIEAGRATLAHEQAVREWREEREAHYKPIIRAEVKKFDAALEVARRASDELAAVCSEARADGGGGAVWFEVLWPEFGRSTPSRDSRLDAWRSCLRRNGWL